MLHRNNRFEIWRNLLHIIATFIFIAASHEKSISAEKQGEKSTNSRVPNIVLILADDQGYADTGYYGSKQVLTPNIDKLAASGIVLDSHYVQPVCSPTRASLMTGRFVTHTGVYSIVRPTASWGLPLEERTLAQALREAGYTTAECGKWHLGEFEPAYRPTQRGFDTQYGPWFGAIDCFTHKRDGIHDWHRNDEPSNDEGYSTHLLAKEACRVIREQPADKPLFLYLPFNAVHAPRQSPAEYTKQFPHLKGERLKYAAMLLALDEAMGQVMDALKAKDMFDNTILVFSSDNGGPDPGNATSNAPLRAGKGTIYEGGIRVCACASWPGHIPPGQHTNEPVHVVDWYPTLVKIAGGSLAQKLPLDGLDILPVLTEGAKTPHETLLLPGMAANQAAIRKGDWKLLSRASDLDAEESKAEPTSKGVELYNLASDIGEKKNVAAEHPEIVKELETKLAQYLKDAVPFGGAGKQPGKNPKKK